MKTQYYSRSDLEKLAVGNLEVDAAASVAVVEAAYIDTRKRLHARINSLVLEIKKANELLMAIEDSMLTATESNNYIPLVDIMFT